MKRRELFDAFSSPSNRRFLHRKWQTVSDLPFWIHRLFAESSANCLRQCVARELRLVGPLGVAFDLAQGVMP